MSMSDRTEYPRLLTKVQPTQAVEILNDRVAQVKRLNLSIADWLSERTRLEEQYAAGLRKLALKPIDDLDLGIFSLPWSTLTNSMNTLADSHSSLASKIEVDVERPLREFGTRNREMQAMLTIQGNLASLAKDVDRAYQKTDKLQGKGDRADANKVANASSDLDNAQMQWDSQAPYVFENLQALDEMRVNLLRDLLTQYVTLEADQTEKNRAAAEQSLNVLLNVETADEIKTFALKALSAKPTANRANRMSMMPGVPTIPTPSRGGSSSGPSPLAPIRSIPDGESQYSGGTPEPTKKSGFKGLKRLGTVMSRRNSKMPEKLASTAESGEPKPRSSPFGRLGRNKDSYSLDSPQEGGSSQRPYSPVRVGSEVMEPPQSRQETFSPSGAPQLNPIPSTNGNVAPGSPTAFAFQNGSHQGDLAGLEPPRPAQSEAPSAPYVAEPARDNEGYSSPPQNLDPISQAQADAADGNQPAFNVNIRNAPIHEEGDAAALASVAGKLQAPPPSNARRMGTVRGRRDARNSAIISPQGSMDNYSAEPTGIAPPLTSERSFERPSPSLTTPAPSQAFEQAVPPATSFPAVQPPIEQLPSGFSQPSSAPFNPVAAVGTAAPFNPNAEPTSPLRTLAREHTGDNGSIRSGRSTASQGMKHPELHEAGLSSSIVETVSARFENGQVMTSSLIGEIALAYNPGSSSTSHGQDTIRIDNFSALDKVAPNPGFITQVPGKEGEYSVVLSNIARTQVAFKYQIRHEDATTQTPLLVTPAFRIDSAQAMVIVSYSLHPSFNVAGRDSITVSNVTLALTLDGAKASSCQSKPVGTFARERNLVFWQLGDIVLRPGGAPEKLLAKFATDGEATGGHVEGKWEISGDGALAVGSGLAVSQHAGEGGGADPFADEDGAQSAANWKAVPTVRKLMSGNYVSK